MLKRNMSRFFVDFFSHSAEEFRRGILLCLVSENFRSPKTSRIRVGGGSMKFFPRKIFVSQV